MGRILIVDDEEGLRMILGEVLKRKGYEVIFAVDGQDGLEKAAAEKPDVILLDIMMPRLNGIEACQAMQNNSVTKRIPVIMLTTRKELEVQRGTLDIGAWDYIGKPFNMEEFIPKIERALEEKAIREEEAEKENK